MLGPFAIFRASVLSKLSQIERNRTKHKIGLGTEYEVKIRYNMKFVLSNRILMIREVSKNVFRICAPTPYLGLCPKITFLGAAYRVLFPVHSPGFAFTPLVP